MNVLRVALLVGLLAIPLAPAAAADHTCASAIGAPLEAVAFGTIGPNESSWVKRDGTLTSWTTHYLLAATSRAFMRVFDASCASPTLLCQSVPGFAVGCVAFGAQHRIEVVHTTTGQAAFALSAREFPAPELPLR